MADRPSSKGPAAKKSSTGNRSGSGGGRGGSGGAGDATNDDGEFRSGPAPRTALIAGRTFGAKAVRYVEVDGLAMFEGDIVLGTVEQVEQTSGVLAAQIRGELAAAVAITGNQFRWPNCTVPFDIDTALPNQTRVNDAIAHWESQTNYTFVLRTNANAAQFPDWVTFRPSTGCSSSVGRQGNQQFINLGSGCTAGNTIHEIGHAIGLWHEQSREDRDAFVTIQWDKIEPGFEHNFDQHIVDGDDIGPYDYGSIMHYPRDAFSVDGSDTITPVDPAATIGQRTALSAGDIAAANSLCTGGGTGIETIKEVVETIKEQIPETVKERFPETVKELAPETIKEQSPETVKEQSPETIKEQFPETVKELAPETIKEQIPETIKERVPETRKEFIETAVEQIPGLPPVVSLPGPGGGQVPFAMRTPRAGDADGAEDQLLAQLAAVNQAVDATHEQLQALVDQQQQLTAALHGLGWQ